MKQLTIRGFDKELEQYLYQLAKDENISLNKATVKLLRQAAGLDRKKRAPDIIGNALDEFIGVWSSQEEHQFNDAIQVFEVVDDTLR